MKVQGITVVQDDFGTKYTADLGDDGKVIVTFPHPKHDTGQYSPKGAVYGNWVSKDGQSWMASNNYNYDETGINYDGIEVELSPENVGQAFEYFWNQHAEGERIWQEQKRREAHEAYLERKARRERREAKRRTLKGGINSEINPDCRLFSV